MCSCVMGYCHYVKFDYHLFVLSICCRQVDFSFSVYGSLSDKPQAPSAICSSTGNGLNTNQISECNLQPDAALAIAEGALYGLQECSRQLSIRRWNCSHQDKQLFKNGLQKSKQIIYLAVYCWIYILLANFFNSLFAM